MSFWDLFQNPDGSLSSRRVMGVLIVVYAIVAMSVGLFDGMKGQIVLGIGSLLLASTAPDQHRGPQ